MAFLDLNKLDIILAMVRAEAASAMSKHASMNSPHEGISVIKEEVDELWAHVKVDTGLSNAALKEAIQIATMGVRYAHDLCAVDDLEG